jgi:hypothetical protein
MAIRGLAAALALAGALAATGCAATMKDAVLGKASGTAAVYPVPPAQAWELAEQILWDETRCYAQDYKDRGFVCLKAGLGSDETFISVWVEPREKPGESLVTIVTRRAVSTQIAVALSEDRFHERFREATTPRRKGRGN